MAAGAHLLCSNAFLLTLAGCATASMEPAGSLSSYDNLAPSNGLLAHALLRVSKDAVVAAQTVQIAPTAWAATADTSTLSPAQRGLIANAIDRSLCFGLSERFKVVGPAETADLTVHAVIAHVTATNAASPGSLQWRRRSCCRAFRYRCRAFPSGSAA
jgi:hypothetical protein